MRPKPFIASLGIDLVYRNLGEILVHFPSYNLDILSHIWYYARSCLLNADFQAIKTGCLEQSGAKSTPTMKQIVKEIHRQLRKSFTEGSHPLSAILRLLFERKQAKNFVGSQIIALTVVYGAVAVPIHAFDYANTRPQFVDGSVFVPVTTETTYMMPVVRPLGISQGYGRFHPAIDVRAPRGSEVVAMSDGVVIEAKYTAAGYGKHIRILHDGNTITLSAHLDTMSVVAGDKVTKGQQIGTIGMTGWTTGPHLHFEVTQDTKYVDPMSVIR